MNPNALTEAQKNAIKSMNYWLDGLDEKLSQSEFSDAKRAEIHIDLCHDIFKQLRNGWLELRDEFKIPHFVFDGPDIFQKQEGGK